QAEFGMVPVGAISGNRTFREDLWSFGVEEPAEEVMPCHCVQVGALDAITKESSGLNPTNAEHAQVIRGVAHGIFGNDDRITWSDVRVGSLRRQRSTFFAKRQGRSGAYARGGVEALPMGGSIKPTPPLSPPPSRSTTRIGS